MSDENPGWCEFDGTPESCTVLVDWFGGPAAGVARWKTTTYEGGWLLNEDGSDGAPFGPGDTIFRDGDTYRVEHGPGWDARLDAIFQRGDELMEDPLDKAIRLLRATRPVLRHHAQENPTARNVLSAVAAFLARYEEFEEVEVLDDLGLERAPADDAGAVAGGFAVALSDGAPLYRMRRLANQAHEGDA